MLESKNTSHGCNKQSVRRRHAPPTSWSEPPAAPILQALRIADAAGNPEAALTAHPDITHIFFLADSGGGGKQFAAALDAFQRLVDTAEAAGCRLQQTHFSAARHQAG